MKKLVIALSASALLVGGIALASSDHNNSDHTFTHPCDEGHGAVLDHNKHCSTPSPSVSVSPSQAPSATPTPSASATPSPSPSPSTTPEVTPTGTGGGVGVDDEPTLPVTGGTGRSHK